MRIYNFSLVFLQVICLNLSAQTEEIKKSFAIVDSIISTSKTYSVKIRTDDNVQFISKTYCADMGKVFKYLCNKNYNVKNPDIQFNIYVKDVIIKAVTYAPKIYRSGSYESVSYPLTNIYSLSILLEVKNKQGFIYTIPLATNKSFERQFGSLNIPIQENAATWVVATPQPDLKSIEKHKKDFTKNAQIFREDFFALLNEVWKTRMNIK